MGGILAKLITGPVLTALAGALLGPIESIYKQYVAGQISKEQLAEKLQEALVDAFKDVDKTFLDSITSTYNTFITTAAQNPIMTRAWSIVLYSQLFVLLWHQLAIPALATLGVQYKSSGTTVDWAYALVGLCIGAPALVSRIGPAANWAGDAIKKLVGK